MSSIRKVKCDSSKAHCDDTFCFRQIFEADFISRADFVHRFILPTFGAEHFDVVNSGILISHPELADKIIKNHILAIECVGNIDISGNKLMVYEIVVDELFNFQKGRAALLRLIKMFADEFDSAMMVFHYQNGGKRPWWLSFVEKISDRNGQTLLRRYSYPFEQGRSAVFAAEQFAKLAENKGMKLNDVIEAFSVQALTRAFYSQLLDWYTWAQDRVTFPDECAASNDNGISLKEHLIHLITRLIFVWFLKQKKLVAWELFDVHEIGTILKSFDPLAGELDEDCVVQRDVVSNYYYAVLQNLFFVTFNCEIKQRAFACKDASCSRFYLYPELFRKNGKEKILKLFDKTPLFNVDLFDCLDKMAGGENEKCVEYHDGFSQNDERIGGRYRYRAFVPNVLFFNDDGVHPGIITILNRYCFSVEESSCDDVSIALDPEVLGKVFENLLADMSPETQNTERTLTGSFYTPREIVRYMADRSIEEYLKTNLKKINTELIDRFVREDECPDEIQKQSGNIRKALFELKIFDPACGSGAFPIGLMQSMIALLQKLDHDEEKIPAYKKHIIEHCLYGVDIQPIAVQITKLRCIISLLASLEPDEIYSNLGILSFSGLEKKFVAANTLIPKENNIDSCRMNEQDDEIRSSRYFDAEWMFDVHDGFDIVIGNPPYGAKMSEEEKIIYKKHYQWLFKRFDIYMVFFELGLKLCKNVLCYITPDKWLSKSFGVKFRKYAMVPNMFQVVHLGNHVFDEALVDAIISMFKVSGSKKLTLLKVKSKHQFEIVNEIDKTKLEEPYLIDQYFQEELPEIITQIERHSHRLCEYAKCEYACASPADAYRLQKIIQSNQTASKNTLKLINTGLINKFFHRWNDKQMTYLKNKYKNPFVDIQDLTDLFGEHYVEKMTSPKLIIKGLNLLDCTIDLDGSLMSTVATLNIRSTSKDLLCVLGAIINSSVMTAYCKAKYFSSSFCGGLLFTPEMINQLPVPDLSSVTEWKTVIELVKKAINGEKNLIKEIDELVKKNFNTID